jgi:hypothetical protein
VIPLSELLDKKSLRRYQYRVGQRNHRHGNNWRQVVVDCAGLCVWKDNEGYPCCSIENLQFHEPFGEDKLGWGIFQQRVLLCSEHHDIAERHYFERNRMSYQSLVLEDVSLEILACGSYDKWVERYGLKDRFGCRLFA